MAYTTLVTGTTITASWANASVRDQVISPFSSTANRDAAITSPVTGMVSYISSNDAAEGLVSRSSAGQWRKPWNMAWGIQGYASTGSSQTGVGTSATALTSLSVPMTAVANRLLRITAIVNYRQRTSTGVVTVEIVHGGSTVIATHAESLTSADDYGNASLTMYHIPSAGAITYSLRAKTSANTVDINPQGLSTVPSAIFVDDCGPTGAPA